MSELTPQQMIDTIRKGDKLGQDFMAQVAQRLEVLNFGLRMGELDAAALVNIGAALGNRRPDAFADYAAAVQELLAENERLRAAIKNVIAYDHCNECGEGCLVFFEEKPCHANSRPCEEVFTLLKLVWPEFVEQECKENGGNHDI